MRGYSENDKDCPVCHSKNLQLIDALQAQNESRDQHEIFHNQLDRSIEPFSVVAEYFGRGMFNKIVIVDEQEQDDVNVELTVPSVQTVREVANPLNQYGAGAESRMRLEEGNVNNNNRSPAGHRNVPLSEGRMRSQEQSRYSSSLEANISRGTDLMARHQQQQRDRSPKYSAASSSSGKTMATPTASVANVPSKAISGDGLISRNLANPKKASASAEKSKNPFDDEDDSLGPDADYDESKNPFADEADGDKFAEEAVNDKETNPFDEYDNNLNPFA